MKTQSTKKKKKKKKKNFQESQEKLLDFFKIKTSLTEFWFLRMAVDPTRTLLAVPGLTGIELFKIDTSPTPQLFQYLETKELIRNVAFDPNSTTLLGVSNKGKIFKFTRDFFF